MIRAAIMATMLATPALSCDGYVVHVASYHTDRDLIPDVNELNLGLGCRIGATEIGVYHNSYSDVSAYALYDWIHSSGIGVFAGIASGYQQDVGVPDHGITGIGGVVYRRDAVTVRATPSFTKATGSKGVVVSLSFSFGDS